MLEQPNLRAAIAVALGAIAGALSRALLAAWAIRTGPGDFPAGTLLANLIGCFLMGLITELAVHWLTNRPELKLLLTTGFLGSLTTFSSYELDVTQLVDQPGFQSDLLYWLGSPVLGLLLLFLGMAIGNNLAPSSTRSE
ncbi:MAG: fluoride efflux transporter CrcB [Leptolyngbyaceae cyanobacterium]